MTMPMQDIFARGIDQQFNGVIKANDEKDLTNEVNDYVLTAELQSNLEKFLDLYNDPGNHQINGVWISGFYGSGKSHLLKMISHIIGDVPRGVVNHGTESSAMSRKDVVEAFRHKATEQGNHFLEGQIARTLTIPTTSILFNIGQKTNQNSSETVMDAFVRVFNETRGYAGSQPAIALFERDLDRRGWLDDFRKAFEEEAPEPWQTARNTYGLWDYEIRTAYAKVTGKPVENDLVGQYDAQYRHYTVEDFTNDVMAWLDRQAPTQRVVFLVDEIGQFIGDHTERMLELQSIVEGLAVKSNGRAWMVVTSQEDMDAMVGDRTKQQSYDFSKIEARFRCKLKLNSTDVIEVIQKRLLTKTAQGEQAVGQLWDEQHENLRTLFDFDDAGKSYNHMNHYDSEQAFAASYPFVDYQFPLLQNSLRKLSEYNMFSGEYQSVGERSMISAINDVLHTCKGSTVGDLMPFDRLYEGISDALQSTATYRIRDAKKQLDPQYRDLGVRILKVLLLLKHVDGMKGTVRNLRVLLTDRFNEDVLNLEERIKETLQELEKGTYIERVSDGYSYLTNDEKDIEQEIKNVEVDHADVIKPFLDIVTNDVLKSSGKVVFGPQRKAFRFGLEIDGAPQSTGKPDVWLNLVTSTDEADRAQAVRLSYGREDELVGLLGADDPTLFDDFRMYQKTNIYTMRTDTSAQSEIRRSIITGKISTNRQLYAELKKRVARALTDTAFYRNGTEIQIKANDPRTRVDEALQDILRKLYSNYMLIGDASYSENQLAQVIADAAADGDGTLEGTDATKQLLDAPSEEILAWVTRRYSKNVTTTVQEIVTTFDARPYGWPVAATLTCLAYLYGTGRITLEFDGKPVARTEAARLLRDTRRRDAVLVSIPKVYDQQKVQRLRSFARDYLPSTNQASSETSPADLAAQVKAGLQQRLQELKTIKDTQQAKFPFVDQLADPIDRLEQVASKNETWLIEEFTDPQTVSNMEILLDDDVDTVAPITGFIRNRQGQLYAEGMAWLLDNHENIDASPSDVRQLRDQALELAHNPNIYRGSLVRQFNELVENIRKQIETALDQERTAALGTVQAIRTQIEESDAYQAAPQAAQHQADRTLDDAQHDIEHQSTILGIRDRANRLRDVVRPDIINALNAALPPEPAPEASTGQQPAHAEPVAAPAPPRKAVSLQAIPIPRSKDSLKTKDDVDEFLDAYRRTLITAIENGEQILL
ncbi:BREX system P-loop protein BrxC [Bifidobacterium cuniculi]|nr:BREX system P-loop protein BrxC [Bifidobacterium cuniculi]